MTNKSLLRSRTARAQIDTPGRNAYNLSMHPDTHSAVIAVSNGGDDLESGRMGADPTACSRSDRFWLNAQSIWTL